MKKVLKNIWGKIREELSQLSLVDMMVFILILGIMASIVFEGLRNFK